MRYSIDELAALSGLSARTIRYYIAEGLMDRPEGEKRGAHYLPRHLEQLHQVRQWTEAGHSHEAIRSLRASGSPPRLTQDERLPAESWTRLRLAEGVELHLQTARAGLSPAQVQALSHQLRDLIQGLHQATPQLSASDA